MSEMDYLGLGIMIGWCMSIICIVIPSLISNARNRK